jgi:hypothetical protein
MRTLLQKPKTPLQPLPGRTGTFGLNVSAPADTHEQEADRAAEYVMRMPEPVTQRICTDVTGGAAGYGLLQRKSAGVADGGGSAPEGFLQSLGQGQPLDVATKAYFEPRFGHDFSRVRVHSGPGAVESARSVNAQAYTVGSHVVFDRNRYDPAGGEGRELLAHELAHVVQQRGGSAPGESSVPRLSAVSSTVQRRISIRDVGRGEQSGMARLDEFVARLNEASTGLDFRVEGGFLLADPRESGTLSEFDRQMQDYITDTADIPMRMTNRHGLLGNRRVGYHWGVELDAWQSAYVDIDDFLASSPTEFMTALTHLLRERQQTRNYARRIGSSSLDTSQPGPDAEFRRAHGAGLDAELAILRDYLQDPSVRFIDRETRLLRNDRGDRIQERLGSGAGGLHAGRWVVRLQGTGRVISLEEYREMLESERTRDQVRRERLGGATEYREGGRSVPAP